MNGTESDRFAEAIGRSVAYHTSDQPFWKVLHEDVARDVGKAVADVIAQICMEDRLQPFTSNDLDRFLNRVTESYDATYRRRIEDRRWDSASHSRKGGRA